MKFYSKSWCLCEKNANERWQEQGFPSLADFWKSFEPVIEKLQLHYKFVTFWTNMERIMEASKE